MHVFKFSVTLILLVILSLSSCQKFKDFKVARTELLEERKGQKKQRKEDKIEANNNDSQPVVQDSNPVEISPPETPVNKEDSLYLTYERTPCFGRCPIYKVSIYNSGYAIYEGVNFVEKMGQYGTVIADIDLAMIEKKLTDIYFFQLEDKYDNEQVSDLPSKIIEVRKPSINKKIVARTDVPDKLKELFEEIDKVVDSVTWTPLN